MRNWHSIYEILQFPIGVLYVALFFVGLGTLFISTALASIFTVDNMVVLGIAEASIRLGSFLIINFPLLFLVRLVTRKAGSATSILSAIIGYVAYLVMTMCFAQGSLPQTAYSSILGLSTTNTAIVGTSGARYPLQTGAIATIVITMITLSCFNRTRLHNEYRLFGFISREVWCVIQTIVFCMIAGVVIAWAWPAFIQFFLQQIAFISADTTNPINLALYGILDRVSNILNMSALVRTPFWYGTSGGSWINMAGSNMTGDVSIWTNQITTSSLTGMTGRFITPYYILNLFATPGILWGMFSTRTDRVERKKMIAYYVIITIISMLSGTLLPLEISLLFASPLLYLMHLGLTGILFGLLQSMHLYLGFQYTGTSTIAVLPGTLPEFLTYFRNSNLRSTCLVLLVVGVITFVVYFLLTRFYYRHLALDLFHTGEKDRLVQGTIQAVGGASNIKMTQSSPDRLIISLYDPSLLNINQLRRLGSIRVYETKAGYSISYGAASTMVRMGITEVIRNTVRPSA